MLQRFIRDNKDADVAQLALQRNRYPMLSDSDFRFCLQQIDGRQRTRDKLPLFATIDGWIYPPRLNLEQCSSERTARFKASLLAALKCQLSIVNCQLIDGTGGYGVDTFFMSAEAQQTHYFEQNADLAAIAEHNFRLAGKTIHCHPEPFDLEKLSTLIYQLSTILYLDPARRDVNGGKVFRLEDCTPNVVDIVRYVQLNCPNLFVLLKLSPMLDFHQAVCQLGGAWDVYIVSVAGEVKELLLLSSLHPITSSSIQTIHAVSLDDAGEHTFSFTPDEERNAEVQYVAQSSLFSFSEAVFSLSASAVYLFEPDAAFLKAGAFRLLGARYGLLKAAPNTHLYLTDNPELFAAIPLRGRVWRIVGVYTRAKELQSALTRANVLARNYVLTADALRKQLRVKDGGDDYIIGCRIADRPMLLHCRRM